MWLKIYEIAEVTLLLDSSVCEHSLSARFVAVYNSHALREGIENRLNG